MNFSGIFAGITTIDIQYFTDVFPAPNRKIKTGAPQILVGGPATNAAVAFSVLNNGATLASAVGRNPFSDFIQDDMQNNNIRHIDITPSATSNPMLASVITTRATGDRTIFTHHPGKIIPEARSSKIIQQEKPQILMLDGFYPEVFLKWASLAKKQNVPVVMDCGSWKNQYLDLIPLANVVICSADFIPPGCKSVGDVFNFLSGMGVAKAAISRGGSNLLFADENGRQEVPVEKVNIKDSLGAGDFLHGAFCYYYLQLNHDFQKALIKAVKFATHTCMHEGTRSWIKSYREKGMIQK